MGSVYQTLSYANQAIISNALLALSRESSLPFRLNMFRNNHVKSC